MRKERAVSNEKATVLIVDDDQALRHTLCAILAATGYEVRSAEDGFAALAELQESLPDILLSDLNMPRMSGFELLSVVHGRFPALHVIAMSGAYAGYAIPPGVAAEAFYEKGSNIKQLLQLLETMSRVRTNTATRKVLGGRIDAEPPAALAPVFRSSEG
jgi:DNA-binding NtrC family response regulator